MGQIVAEAEPAPVPRHVEGITVGGEEHVDRVEEQRERDGYQVADRGADEGAPIMRCSFLQTLAAENIRSIEVVYFVFHSANPAKLIMALRAYHVVAAALLLLDNEAALRAVRH